MMRRFSIIVMIRRFSIIFFGLLMIFEVVVSVQQVLQARATVRADWALAVAVGLAASLTLAAMVAGVWWANRRWFRARWLQTVLALGTMGVFLVGVFYTVPAPADAPEMVTTAFQLGAVAFMIPLYIAVATFAAWVGLRRRRDRSLW